MTRQGRMRGGLAVAIAVLTIAFTGAARAASANGVSAGKLAVLTFDPAKTTIAYTLTGWPHETHGTFKLQRGMIRIDPENGKMSGELVVAAATGDSGHSLRDARMKDSILEVQRFPYITFAPRQVENHGMPPGQFAVVVRGVMTLHGGEHTVTIAAKVLRRGDTVTVHTNFAVPYVAWGLENPGILFFTVAKVVDLRVTAVAHLSWVSP